MVHVVEDQPEHQCRAGNAERQAPFDAGAKRWFAIERTFAIERRLIEGWRFAKGHGSLLWRLRRRRTRGRASCSAEPSKTWMPRHKACPREGGGRARSGEVTNRRAASTAAAAGLSGR